MLGQDKPVSVCSLTECCTEYCSPSSSVAHNTKWADIHLGGLELCLGGLSHPSPGLATSLQPPRSTRSSSVATLSRPPTISSLKITDRSFRYASPRLWNQLRDSFRQPDHSRLDSPPHPLLNSSLSSSTLSSSITPPLFHSRLKTYLFNKSFSP